MTTTTSVDVSRDAVLAVLDAADRPLSTAQIAAALRRRAGLPEPDLTEAGRETTRAWADALIGLLRDLDAAGDVMRNRLEPGREQRDEGFPLPPDARQWVNYYMTHRRVYGWGKEMDHRAAVRDLAREDLHALLAAFPDHVGSPAAARVAQDPGSGAVTASVTLTPAQLSWLTAATAGRRPIAEG